MAVSLNTADFHAPAFAGNIGRVHQEATSLGNSPAGIDPVLQRASHFAPLQASANRLGQLNETRSTPVAEQGYSAKVAVSTPAHTASAQPTQRPAITHKFSGPSLS